MASYMFTDIWYFAGKWPKMHMCSCWFPSILRCLLYLAVICGLDCLKLEISSHRLVKAFGNKAYQGLFTLSTDHKLIKTDFYGFLLTYAHCCNTFMPGKRHLVGSVCQAGFFCHFRLHRVKPMVCPFPFPLPVIPRRVEPSRTCDGQSPEYVQSAPAYC